VTGQASYLDNCVVTFYLGSTTVALRPVQGRYDTLAWILEDHTEHPRRALFP